ncbi:MAG: cation diffusion facilitator family transporter [Gemmataceae bacterium]
MHGKSIQQLYRQSRRAALWTVAVTLSLGLAKLAGGLLGHSLALLSDSVHSLGDALAAASVAAALCWAQRPADREHPYGHSRAEAVAGSSVSLLMILSGLWVGGKALHGLGETAPAPEAYTLGIAAVSVLFNEGLFRYSSRVARRTGSRALLSAAWDQRLDACGSLVVLVGLSAARWGGLHAADHVAALAVALVILWAGSRLFWGSLHELMDSQADPRILSAVRREALAVEGVRGVEKLLVRKAGLEYLVDIHVEVDPEISVREGHAIGHAVKDRLLARIVTVKDALVHIEPAPSVKDGHGE